MIGSLAAVFIVLAVLSVLRAMYVIVIEDGPRDEQIKRSLFLAIALGIIAIALVLASK